MRVRVRWIRSIGRTRAKSLMDQRLRDPSPADYHWAAGAGAEMSELELAEQLSMSKTPVREALARLGSKDWSRPFRAGDIG